MNDAQKTPTTPIEWLLSSDTGISSKTILAVMTNSVCGYPDTPSDPSDFGRCYRLLQLFPEWRSRMSEMGKRFPSWGPMAAAWEEITAMYEAVLASGNNRAPDLYDRMKVLIDEGRIADGWEQPSPGCWCKGKASSMTIGGVTVAIGANQ